MQISELIHQLRAEFQIPISPDKTIDRFVNLFLIAGRKVHLIDTGVHHSLPSNEAYLNQLGYKLSDIGNILLTHSHPDHIGALKPIVEQSGATVIAHSAEAKMIENVDFQYSVRPVPGFHQLVAGSVNVDRIIGEDDEINLEDGLTIRVLHTPGHSSGSVSYFLVEEGILFTGDAVLLPGEIPIFENTAAYFNSLEKIGRSKPKLLLSAWDDPRCAEEIPALLARSRTYIGAIQAAVNKVAMQTTSRDLSFCLAVLSELGLPPVLANPLLLNSFMSCLN